MFAIRVRNWIVLSYVGYLVDFITVVRFFIYKLKDEIFIFWWILLQNLISAELYGGFNLRCLFEICSEAWFSRRHRNNARKSVGKTNGALLGNQTTNKGQFPLRPHLPHLIFSRFYLSLWMFSFSNPPQNFSTPTPIKNTSGSFRSFPISFSVYLKKQNVICHKTKDATFRTHCYFHILQNHIESVTQLKKHNDEIIIFKSPSFYFE